MRLIHFILLLLGIILALLISLLLIHEPIASTGVAHPQFPGMNVGGDGRARLAGSVWLIYWLGALVHLLMAVLVALGVSPRKRRRLFWGLLGLVIVAVEWVWTAMYGAYLAFLNGEPASYMFGFPVATSWMLYGVWLAGASLCLVYVLGFRRFVFSDADEAAYEVLRREADVPRVAPAERESA